MRNRKRVFSIFLSIVMILALTACGSKAPSPEDLFAGIGQPDPAKLQDLEIKITADVKSEDTRDVTLDVSAGIAMCGNVAHLYGLDLSMGMSGFNLGITGEAWVDKTANASYTRMTMFGQDSGWERSSLGSGDDIMGADLDMGELSDLTNKMSNIWTGDYNFTMRDRDKKGDYIIDWVIPADKLNSAASGAGLADVSDSIPMGDANASAVFDYNTKQIKSLNISGLSDGSEMALTINFKSWNADGNLAVPQDVIDSAVESNDNSDSGFGLGDFSGSEDDNVLDGDLTGSGEWAEMNSDGPFWSDGSGSDSTIDSLGRQIYDTLDWDTYSSDMIRLWHMGEYSELDFTHESDENWTGSLEVRHYTDFTYGGAEGYLSSMKSAFSGMYDDDPYFINETEVLYIDGGDSLVLCRVLPGQDLVIQADLYDYSGQELSDDALLSHLSELLSLAGFQA